MYYNAAHDTVSHGLFIIIIIFKLNQSESFVGHLILPCVRIQVYYISFKSS